jgi:cell division protein FtsQ
VKQKRGLPLDLPLQDLPLQGLPTQVPEEAPFLRSQTRTRARRPRKGSLTKLSLVFQLFGSAAVGVFGAWSGYTRVMASESLRVERVDVTGTHFLSEGEVRELLGPAVGRNVLTLDLEALQKRLRDSPWVADAVVRRTLPNTLQVEVKERVPLALAEMDRLYLMDSEGGLIDLYGPQTASFDLPIVRGLTGIGAEARRARAERAGMLLKDLGDLEGEVSEVSVEDSGVLRVVLKGQGEVLLMSSPPFRSRLATFLSLRKELRERCPKAEYFDLRFRDRIYAKPQENKAAQKAVRGG